MNEQLARIRELVEAMPETVEETFATTTSGQRFIRVTPRLSPNERRVAALRLLYRRIEWQNRPFDLDAELTHWPEEARESLRVWFAGELAKALGWDLDERGSEWFVWGDRLAGANCLVVDVDPYDAIIAALESEVTR